MSLIVAAFMAGLGLGSHVGGVLSARVSPRRALRALRPDRGRGGPLRRGELPPVLRRPRRPCRGPLPDDRRRRARALRRVPAAHGAHGHVAAVPRARHRPRDGTGAARDRHPLRRERPGCGGRRPSRAVGARALPGHGGGRPRGGRRQSPGRGRRPRRRPPGGRRRSPPWRRRPRRRATSRGRLLRPVDPALRPVRLRRPVVRDPLVPADGRGSQEHGLHVRHRALHLPAGPRRGEPRRRPPRGRARPAARGVPRLPAAPARGRRRRGRAPRPAAARHARLRAGSSTTGGRTRSSSSERTGTRGPSRGSTASCPWRSTAFPPS